MHSMILKMGGLGDILMATPAVRALKRSFPEARVTFLVGRSNKQVMADNPYIDDLLDLDDRAIFKPVSAPISSRKLCVWSENTAAETGRNICFASGMAMEPASPNGRSTHPLRIPR